MPRNATRGVLLEPPLRTFACPSCDATHTVRDARPITPMHPCRGLKGLTAPYVETHGRDLGRHAVRHTAVERGDYVNGELVTTDGDDRPVMAVRTDRADGSNDCTVYVPPATP
jgi:hypothetical protein